MLDLDTPHGPAKAHLRPAEAPVGAARSSATEPAAGPIAAGDRRPPRRPRRRPVAASRFVEQAYRVAGRASPAPAASFDAASTVVGRLRAREAGRPADRRRRPLVRRAGGLPTAAATDEVARWPPLGLPGASAGRPNRTRQPELDAVASDARRPGRQRPVGGAGHGHEQTVRDSRRQSQSQQPTSPRCRRGRAPAARRAHPRAALRYTDFLRRSAPPRRARRLRADVVQGAEVEAGQPQHIAGPEAVRRPRVGSSRRLSPGLDDDVAARQSPST